MLQFLETQKNGLFPPILVTTLFFQTNSFLYYLPNWIFVMMPLPLFSKAWKEGSLSVFVLMAAAQSRTVWGLHWQSHLSLNLSSASNIEATAIKQIFRSRGNFWYHNTTIWIVNKPKGPFHVDEKGGKINYCTLGQTDRQDHQHFKKPRDNYACCPWTPVPNTSRQENCCMLLGAGG